MNRRIRGMLLFLCAACVLALPLFATACDRTEDPDLPSRAEVSSEETYAPDKNGVWYMQDLMALDYEFPIEGLYGKPREALTQTDDPAIFALRDAGEGLDTDAGILFALGRNPVPVPILYDKTTGRFSLACTDPLCGHDTSDGCIWARSFTGSISRGGDRLLFMVSQTDGETISGQIFSGDLAGNDLREMYQSSGYIGSMTRCGDYLFFAEDRFDPESGGVVHPLLRISVNGGSAEQVLLDAQYSIMTLFLPFDAGRSVLYMDPEDDGCYFVTVETGEKTLFGSGVFPFAVYRGWIYYNAEDGLYRASEENIGVREKVLDECLYYSSDCCFVGDRMYYLRQTVFSESEMFGEYHQYALYSAALDGSDATFLMDFLTDDIPDKISSIWTDGRLLLVGYWPYWDFQNEFHPVFKPQSGGQNPRTISLIDLSAGEKLLFYSSYRDLNEVLR